MVPCGVAAFGLNVCVFLSQTLASYISMYNSLGQVGSAGIFPNP